MTRVCSYSEYVFAVVTESVQQFGRKHTDF